MKYKMLCSLALFAFAAAVTPAQTPLTMTGSCTKPAAQTIPAGDREDHSYSVASGTCTAKQEVNGAKSTTGAYAAYGETSGTHAKGSGTYVVTFEGGDKLYYDYQETTTLKDGAMVSGTNKWRIIGGTGKMKGTKGSGTCKYDPQPDGTNSYECTGTYTQAAAALAKKKM